jgi:hypothetical protein
MRTRSVLLATIATVGGSWVVASSASALEIGPVSVPVSTAPGELPTVGPVVVAAPAVAPQLGVTATVSPKTGVAIDVTTPSALGPIPLAGGSQAVHVGIGPGGGSVVVAPASGQPATASAHAPALLPANGSTPTASDVQSRLRASSVQTKLPEHVPPGRSSATSPARANVVATDNTAGVVNASLQHPASGGLWDMWRHGASARLLWLALLFIALAANWVVGGFLRDALRRARFVSV